MQQQIDSAERDVARSGQDFDKASKEVESGTEAVRQAEAKVTQARGDVERAQRDVESKLAVRLRVLGENPQSFQVSYDFHDPREDVKALVERLLGQPPLPSFS